MQITNTQKGPRGINTVRGAVLLEPDQTIEADVYEREREHIEASGWFKVKGSYTPNPDAGATKVQATSDPTGRIAELERELAARDATIADLEKRLAEKPSQTAAEPKAVHRGGGSYSVMQGDAELIDKLSREEAERFNALSAEDKAKFVASKKG